MRKVKKGPQTWMFPLPALLIGTVVEGKPNFMTAAWGSIANAEPPMISVAIRRNRYTRNGIEVGGGLTVNIPATSQAPEVDFCGIESGSKADKAARCGFTVSICGATGAPMVEECPVNLECKIDQIIELGTHSLVIAFVLETYVSEDCITDGTLDVAKADPLVYLTGTARRYVHTGAPAGDAFSIGLGLRKKD
jgi:flavin reductase (DIM6/NTAB) family NADH-FMN oxidoreductase RutF